MECGGVECRTERIWHLLTRLWSCWGFGLRGMAWGGRGRWEEWCGLLAICGVRCMMWGGACSGESLMEGRMWDVVLARLK